jgi:hypothetical protein
MLVPTTALGAMMSVHGLYQIWPDIPSICNLLVMSTFMAVISARFFNKVLRKSNDCIQAMFKTTIEFYEREEQTPEHRPVLHANIKFLVSLIKYFFLVSSLFNVVPGPTAWILSWYTGELILLSPVYLPYTDPTTPFWYIINSAILAFYEMILFVVIMTSDVFYIFFIYQSVPMVEIYCMKLRKFGEKLNEVKTQKIAEQPGPSTSKNHSRNLWNRAAQMALEHENAKEKEIVEQQLVTLIKEFNTYNEFVAAILFFMEYNIFATMSLNSMGIGLAIVVTLYYSKAIGAVMILNLFLLVLVPCVEGTVILQQKEKLLNEMCAFPWYELSKPKQKIFLQLIHLVQNSNDLNVVIVGDVDMELFTDVMNGAYSYFNYLYNFVDDL